MKIYSDLMNNDNLSNIQLGDLVVDNWGVYVLLNKQRLLDTHWDYSLIWLGKQELITRLYRYSSNE